MKPIGGSSGEGTKDARSSGKIKKRRLDALLAEASSTEGVRDVLKAVLSHLDGWGYRFPRIYRHVPEGVCYTIVDALGLPSYFLEKKVSFKVEEDSFLEEIVEEDDVVNTDNIFSSLKEKYDGNNPIYWIRENFSEARGGVGLPYVGYSCSHPKREIRGVIAANYCPGQGEGKKEIDNGERELLRGLRLIVGTQVMGRLVDEVNLSLVKKLERGSREKDELIERLRQQAFIDGLTSLYSRNKFNIDILDYMDKVKEGESYYLICIDLDWFKGLNDAHGHLAGDDFLHDFGRLLGSVRGAESYRIGGEEFVVVVPSSSLDYVIGIAKELQRDIQRIPTPDLDRRMTLSIGIAEGRAGFKDYKEWRKKADQALYIAKERRDTLVLYEQVEGGDKFSVVE